MVVVRRKGQLMSVRTPTFGDTIINRGGGGSQGMSTRGSPTPSASELFGSAQQREAQIQAFRVGGQQAFNRLKQQQRAEVERKRLSEQQKRLENIRINKERERRLLELRRKLRSDLAKQKNALLRNQLVNQFNQNAELIKIQAGARKVEAGVLTGFRTPELRQVGFSGGVVRDKEGAKEVIKIIDKQLGKTPTTKKDTTKPKTNQEKLIDKFLAGGKLTALERGLIPGNVLAQANKLKKYNQNKIAVIDLNTGVMRFETREEYNRRITGRTITGQLLKFSEFIFKRFTPKPIQDKLNKADKFISPELRNTLVGVLDAYIKFGIFAPFLTTGTASSGKKVRVKPKTKQVKKIKKADTEKIIRASEKAFKQNDLNRQLTNIADDITKEQTTILRIRKIDNLKRLLTALKDKGLIKGFALDTNTGALRLMSKSGSLVTSNAKISSPITQVIIDITKFDAPKISAGLLQITGAVSSVKINELNKLLKKEKIILATINKTNSQAKVKTLQVQLQNNRQKQLSLTTTLQKQTQRQIQKVKQKQKQKLTQKTKQKLRQQLKTLQTQLQNQTNKIQRLKKVKKIFLIPLSRRKKGKKLIGKKGKLKLFKVLVKVRGKFRKLGKPLRENQALSKGAYFVDNNLSRTFKIVPVGFTSKQGKLLKKELNYFSKHKHKFRKVKIRGGVKISLIRKYIEKSRHIADTKRERKQLRKARRTGKRKVKGKPVRKKKRLSKLQLRKLRLRNLKKARQVRKRKVNRVVRKPIKRKRIVVKRRPVKKRVVKRKVIKRKQIKKRRVKKRVIRRRKPIKRRPVKGRVVRRKPTRKRKPQRRKNIKRRKR